MPPSISTPLESVIMTQGKTYSGVISPLGKGMHKSLSWWVQEKSLLQLSNIAKIRRAAGDGGFEGAPSEELKTKEEKKILNLSRTATLEVTAMMASLTIGSCSNNGNS